MMIAVQVEYKEATLAKRRIVQWNVREKLNTRTFGRSHAHQMPHEVHESKDFHLDFHLL
jgi:hypothetical protein